MIPKSLLSAGLIGIIIINAINPIQGAEEFASLNIVQAKKLGIQYKAEAEALRAQLAAHTHSGEGAGSGSGVLAPVSGHAGPGDHGAIAPDTDTAALAACVAGNNTPYITLAKAKLKANVATAISDATPNKADLVRDLSTAIDAITHASLSVPAPANGEVLTLAATKAAVDSAMLKAVNAAIDRLVRAGAPTIKTALAKVFAGG